MFPPIFLFEEIEAFYKQQKLFADFLYVSLKQVTIAVKTVLFCEIHSVDETSVLWGFLFPVHGYL